MSSQEGFLSGWMNSVVEKIRRDNDPWFQLLRKANLLAMEVLPKLKPGTDDNQKILEATFYGKAIQSIQAVIILAERGMVADARTILRTCVETAILQRKIADDAKFEGQLVERHDYHRRTLGAAVIKDPRFVAEMRSEDLEKIKATIDEIESRYVGRKPKDINLADIAASVNGMHLYTLFFRSMSGDAAHGTLDALARHITTDERGDMTGLAFGPQPREVPETLSATISVLLHVLDTAIERFELVTFRPQLAECVALWKTLAIPDPVHSEPRNV